MFNVIDNNIEDYKEKEESLWNAQKKNMKIGEVTHTALPTHEGFQKDFAKEIDWNSYYQNI